MRLRTAKAVASRIDLSYFKRPHPLRRARTVAIIACVLAAAGWAAYAVGRGDQRVYNPGPVTASHAMFENNCTACHAGDGGEGFLSRNVNSYRVTDAACLKCHDGAIHHQNQVQFVASGAGGGDVANASASASSAHSTHCTACHSEHRGHESLTAAHDAHCLQCHKDLNSGRTKAPPLVQASVTGFSAAGSHPQFGRRLTAKGGAPGGNAATQGAAEGAERGWHDPTPLRYNHAHASHKGIKPLPGAANNCTVCHQLSGGADAPPGTPGSQPSQGSQESGDRRYTRPVSYERHCASCHELKLTAGAVTVKLPHESLAVVRGQLAGLDSLLRDWLAAQPPAERASQLAGQPAGGAAPVDDPFGGDAPPAPAPGAATAPGAAPPRMTEDQWVAKVFDQLREQVQRDVADAAEEKLPGRAALEPLLAAQTAAPKGTRPDPSLLEAYVAYVAADSCARCHDTNKGVLPALHRQAVLAQTPAAAAAPPAPAVDDPFATPDAAPATPAPAPATAPSAAPATAPTGPPLLATLPTGIPPASPRRWFPASQFDHDAHRSMTCVECHREALTSTSTADVLMPAKQSCVQCHHTPSSASRGAGADCQTCHLYHDRKLERSADGPFTLKELLSPPGRASEPPRPPPATRPAETQPVALGIP